VISKIARVYTITKENLKDDVHLRIYRHASKLHVDKEYTKNYLV